MPVAARKPPALDIKQVLLERIDTLDYIAYEYEPAELATRLKRHNYRGAICGPKGCGKSVMLQALGDELMEHGLTPLPLLLEKDQAHQLPMDWRRTIRRARHTDALLLDGFGLLPWWARAWVCFASRRAGAVVVTTPREVRYKTLAKPKPTKLLLKQLITQVLPASQREIDHATLFEQCKGNLREALHLACQQITAERIDAEVAQKQAS